MLDHMQINAELTSGGAIRELRLGAGISVRALAARAGMSHSHLVRIESGERQVPGATLARIVSALADLAGQKRGVA